MHIKDARRCIVREGKPSLGRLGRRVFKGDVSAGLHGSKPEASADTNDGRIGMQYCCTPAHALVESGCRHVFGVYFIVLSWFGRLPFSCSAIIGGMSVFFVDNQLLLFELMSLGTGQLCTIARSYFVPLGHSTVLYSFDDFQFL